MPSREARTKTGRGDFQPDEGQTQAEEANGQETAGLVCVAIVDNSGITRAKFIPATRLQEAVERGLGAPHFGLFALDDTVIKVPEAQAPLLESRLRPDPARVIPQYGSSLLSWAPADQLGPDLMPLATCARTFAKSQITRARQAGLDFRMAFEVEFSLFESGGAVAHQGPGYGCIPLVELEPFALSVCAAAASQALRVEQFHAEYSPGQCEITIAPADPLRAADDYMLLRHTLLRAARNHGLRISFAPLATSDGLGNGTHVHWSAWRDGVNLLARHSAARQLQEVGEFLVGGMLAHLPDIMAILAPSPLSYHRLQPGHWASAFQCWGVANREASIRLLPDAGDAQGAGANAEVKPIDGSANPYLVAGALVGCALHGLEHRIRLPPPLQVDPGLLSDSDRSAHGVARLPIDLGQAVDHMRNSDVARGLLGQTLWEWLLLLREDEVRRLGQLDKTQLVDLCRYRYG